MTRRTTRTRKERKTMNRARFAATVAGAAAAFWVPILFLPTPAAFAVFVGEIAAAVIFTR